MVGGELAEEWCKETLLLLQLRPVARGRCKAKRNANSPGESVTTALS